MPSIQSLYDGLETDHIAFLVITDEDAGTVEAFLRHRQLDLPVYLYDKLSDVFRPPGLPATYIINRDGFIVYRHMGGATWDGEAFRRFIRSLL